MGIGDVVDVIADSLAKREEALDEVGQLNLFNQADVTKPVLGERISWPPRRGSVEQDQGPQGGSLGERSVRGIRSHERDH